MNDSTCEAQYNYTEEYLNETMCNKTYPNSNRCRAVYDNYICWPNSCPGQTVTMTCPEYAATVAGMKAFRVCTDNGTWGNASPEHPNGKTDYDDCFIPKVRDLMKMCESFGNNTCTEISRNVRRLEMVGLSLSFAFLIISLYIFFSYRVLKNNRTNIHKNFFTATLLQVTLRLILYVDQSFGDRDSVIRKIPPLYKSCLTLLEYTKTAMFMWMFIEGLYLHNVITVTFFQEYTYIKIYFICGWAIPGFITIIWLIFMLIGNYKYWDYYYFFGEYWILEGPRNAALVINLLFLLNILRVLVGKLGNTQRSEIEKVRKAVRAAIFLLPLMGVSNIFFQLDYHYTVVWKFALWSCINYFLSTFQGFFIAVLYCFLNGEVQTAIKNSFYLQLSLRNSNYTPCRIVTVVSTTADREHIENGDEPNCIKWCNQVANSPEEKTIE